MFIWLIYNIGNINNLERYFNDWTQMLISIKLNFFQIIFMNLTSLWMKSCKALGTYLRNLYSAVTNL